jgi:hypothetical protein
MLLFDPFVRSVLHFLFISSNTHTHTHTQGLTGMGGPQKFQIHKAFNSASLPTAHTCYNQLDLPEYSSKEMLQKKLEIALREGSEGFGFG